MMTTFNKFCIIVDDIVKLSNELIIAHKKSIINEEDNFVQTEIGKDEVINLRDRLYNISLQAKTGDSILDHIIQTCIVIISDQDVRTIHNWYTLCSTTNNMCLRKCLRDVCISCLINIKNGITISVIKDKFSEQYGFTKYYYNGLLTLLMYVKARYYNDINNTYNKIQTRVSKLSEQCESAKKMSSFVLDKESIINDRIDYLCKDFILVYNELTDLKSMVSMLDNRLTRERIENNNLRMQFQELEQNKFEAFDELCKELVVNNGSLMYISSIRFTPEYNYDAIKNSKRDLHSEFKRIYRLFSRDDE